MKTITDRNEIETFLKSFAADSDGAFPTCRCLPGQWEQENCQEWAEHGEIDGVPAKVYYMFENVEVAEDGADMPWNAEHVSKIELAGGRPSLDIEPMLALIAAEGDLCVARYYRNAYPSEWRKARRLDRINTWRDDTGTEYVSVGSQR